jgi:nucleoside-diphosphate-sugar epimerase
LAQIYCQQSARQPGDIKSERRATSSRNQRATSSESAPVTLRALAEHVIAANGGEKYDIREFPPERKRIDIGDFLTDDTRFRTLSGWHPRFLLADGLRHSLEYYREHLASYL